MCLPALILSSWTIERKLVYYDKWVDDALKAPIALKQLVQLRSLYLVVSVYRLPSYVDLGQHYFCCNNLVNSSMRN
jgi:hypothetical protein